MRPIKIELYRHQTPSGILIGWRWTARRGGRTIAASSEAYGERIAAVDNIALVFGIPLRRLVKPGARTIDVAWYRPAAGGFSHIIEVKTR